MREILTRTLKEMLDSKKFLGAVLAALVIVLTRLAGKFHVVLEPQEAQELANQLVVLASVAIGGQALADHGKSAEEVKAQAPVAELGAPVIVAPIVAAPPQKGV